MTFSTPKHETSKPIPIPRRGISGFPGIFLHILLTLTAAMIPTGASAISNTGRLPTAAVQLISISLLALLAVYIIRTGKLAGKKSRGLIPLLGFIAAVTAYAGQSAIPAAMVISLVFFIGEGSVLIATQSSKNAVWLPLVPLAALGISLATCQSMDTALLCLLPLPAALALAFGTRSSAAKETGLTRVGVICLTSLCLGLTALGFGAWFLYRALGTLEPAAIQALLDDIRAELILSITQIEMQSADGLVRPLEDKTELVSDVVTLTINLLPGAAVVLCNVAAALSQLIALTGLAAYGFGSSITSRVKVYRISAISSFVFLAAWVVSLIANAETSTLIGTVAENFAIILTPGLALAGFIRLITSLARKGCAPGCLIFVLIFFLSSISVILLAGYEAISAVFGPLMSKLKPPKEDPPFPPYGGNGNRRSDNPDDSDPSDSSDSSDTSDDDTHHDGPSLF